MEQRLFGEILRDERKRMGLSLNQAAERLRIRPDILQAIENSDIPNMPPRGYARNMVMGYAKFVGLDPSRMAAMYNDRLMSYEAAFGRPPADRASRNDDLPAIREPRAARRAREAREGRPPAAAANPYEATQRMPIAAAPADDVISTRTAGSYDRTRAFERDDLHYRRGRFDDDYNDRNADAYDDDYQDYEGEGNGGPLASVVDFFSGLASRFTKGEGGGIADMIAGNRNAKLGIIAGALVVLLLIVLLFGFGCGNKDQAAEDNAPATEQTEKVEKETPQAPTSMTFEYKVDEGTEAWVEVYVDGEQQLAEQVNGEQKGSFEVTDNVEFVTATTEGVHVYIDGKEQKLETNDSGLVDMTFTFEDFLADWAAENGVDLPESATDSSADADDAGSSSDATETEATDQSADASSSASATDAGTGYVEDSSAGTQYDSGYVDSGAGNSGYSEPSGSATTDGF